MNYFVFLNKTNRVLETDFCSISNKYSGIDILGNPVCHQCSGNCDCKCQCECQCICVCSKCKGCYVEDEHMGND